METREKPTQAYWLAVAAVALTANWTLYVQAIRPQREREADARREVAALNAQIAAAFQVGVEIRDLETQRASERAELAKLRSDLPSTATVVWLPERLRQHFERFGFPGAATRLNTTLEEPALPECEESYWRVAIPLLDAKHHTGKLLSAVADLDVADGFIRVLDLAVEPNPENQLQPIATLNISTVLPK